MKKLLLVLGILLWTLCVNARGGGGISMGGGARMSTSSGVRSSYSSSARSYSSPTRSYTAGRLSSGSINHTYYVHEYNYHPVSYYNNNMMLWYLIVLNNNTHRYDTIRANSEEELQHKVQKANGEWNEDDNTGSYGFAVFALILFVFVLFIVIVSWLRD